jgi:hypothetical protein
LWKQHLENENKKFQLKIVVNVVVAEHYTPIIPTFVAIRSQQLNKSPKDNIIAFSIPQKENK